MTGADHHHDPHASRASGSGALVMTSDLRCRCGHSIEAHEHFRAGRDCSACGDHGCRRFTPKRAGAGLPISAVVPGVAWNRLRGR